MIEKSVAHPRRLAYVCALAVAALMSVFLIEIPIQLSDSFTEFTNLQGRTWWEMVSAEFYNGAYFRPLKRGMIKIVYDLSAGHYQLAFRGFHAMQIVVLLILAVRMLRIRDRAGLVALPLALAILVGIHTFSDSVVEAFPVNHFLTILICCAAAVNLAQARPRLLVDVAAVALLVFAMLTLESGLIVWVVFAAAWAVGERGVSRRGLIALTACLGAYFIGRFILIGGSVPGLDERSTGFGFAVLGPDELVRRFGANPLPFYIYNVICGLSTVLFAEPRGGVWAFVREVSSGLPEPWQIVNVFTSTATTVIIARYALTRAAAWRAGTFTDADRFVVMFLVVLPANAVFAAAYEKDVIMSPAGLFYAAAAFMVVREMPAFRVAPTLIMLVAIGWTIRYVGIHDHLRARAFDVRDEWAYYDDWAREQRTDVTLTGAQSAIKQRLLDEAVLRRPLAPRVSFGSFDRLIDMTQ